MAQGGFSRPHVRVGLAFTIGILAAWLATGPAAAATMEARVEPAEVRAGEPVRLVLVVRDSGPLDVWVTPEITCEVTTPTGRADAPCSGSAALVELRVLATGEREFVFPYDAVDEAGVYEVTFRVNSLLATPGAQSLADVTFLATENALSPSEGIEEALDGGAPRWLASAAGAAASGSVAVASAIAGRRG